MVNEKDRVWVLVGNSGHAQIYESPNSSLDELTPIHEFVNGEGRQHNRELRDFNIGRVHNKNYPRTKGLRPKASPHELVQKTFARELVEFLEKGRLNGNFDKLMLVAAPHFLGVLRSLLSKQTKAMLWNEIPKELNFEKKEQFVDYFHRPHEA
ncbi:MAG: host attachment protein [Bdellovibrionota bacterium]